MTQQKKAETAKEENNESQPRGDHAVVPDITGILRAQVGAKQIIFSPIIGKAFLEFCQTIIEDRFDQKSKIQKKERDMNLRDLFVDTCCIFCAQICANC